MTSGRISWYFDTLWFKAVWKCFISNKHVHICPQDSHIFIHSREMKTQLRQFEIVNTKPTLFSQIIIHFN